MTMPELAAKLLAQKGITAHPVVVAHSDPGWLLV